MSSNLLIELCNLPWFLVTPPRTLQSWADNLLLVIGNISSSQWASNTGYNRNADFVLSNILELKEGVNSGPAVSSCILCQVKIKKIISQESRKKAVTNGVPLKVVWFHYICSCPRAEEGNFLPKTSWGSWKYWENNLVYRVWNQRCLVTLNG